jgi:hypothetical protein
MDIFKDGKAKEEIPKSGGKYNSWCGIFALAMVKKSGACDNSVHWVQGSGISGLQKLQGKADEVKPGDIIVVDSKLWHHAIVSSIEGDTFHTIDGNSWNQKTGQTQTICEHTRKKSELLAWYKTVPEE